MAVAKAQLGLDVAYYHLHRASEIFRDHKEGAKDGDQHVLQRLVILEADSESAAERTQELMREQGA
jgi:hypothetical protein